MKNIKLIILLLITCVLFCCNSKFDDINQTRNIEIEVNNIERNSNFSSISKYRLIALETNNYCLIGKIDKVIYRNKYIYILDREIAKSVFIFDSNGKFISKIRALGKGPGEYIFLNDMDVDSNGNVYLLDTKQNKILCFNNNGSYKKDIKFDFLTFSFTVVDSTTFIFCQQGIFNEKINSEISIWQSNSNMIKSFFKQDFNKTPKILYHTKDYELFTSNDVVNYVPKNSYQIYEISSNKVYAKYYINFKTLNMPDIDNKDINNNTFIEYINSGKYVYNINNVYENNNNLICTFSYGRNIYLMVYSKMKKKCETYVVGLNNPFLGKLIPLGVMDNQFISQISSSLIINKIRKGKDEESLRKIYGKEAECILSNVKSNDNPILVVYEIQ